jgi:hypothetical protein
MTVTLPTRARLPAGPGIGQSGVIAATASCRSATARVTVLACSARERHNGPTLGDVNEPGAARQHSGQTAEQAAVPVFADPSGRRRQRLRRIGLGTSIFLIGSLVLVGTGLVGGPKTPFSLWGAPPAGSHGQAGARHSTPPSRPGGGSGTPAPGSASSSQPPGPSAHPSPAPSVSASPSPAPSPSPSPAATNPAGHTPPGQNHSKRPRSTKSPHGR